jgi:hypothetical protein
LEVPDFATHIKSSRHAVPFSFVAEGTCCPAEKQFTVATADGLMMLAVDAVDAHG